MIRLPHAASLIALSLALAAGCGAATSASGGGDRDGSASGAGGTGGGGYFLPDAASGAKADASAEAPSADARGAAGSGGAAGAGGHPGADAGPAADAAVADAGTSPADAVAGRDVYTGCHVSISGEPAWLGLVATAGEYARLSVRGTIAWGSTPRFQPVWQWSVRGPDGSPLSLSTISIASETSIIEIPMRTPGDYDIRVSIDPTCTGQAWASARKVRETSQLFFMRVLPPPVVLSGSGQRCDGNPTRWCPSQDAMQWEDTIRIEAGRNRRQDVALTPGILLTADPVQVIPSGGNRPLRVAVPSYLRIVAPNSTWRMDGYTGDNPFRAVLDEYLRYHVLVIPQPDLDGSLSPPFLLPSRLPQELRSESFELRAGVVVSGRITVGDTPVAGARVLLRARDAEGTVVLPSTIGSSNQAGEYGLRASAGWLYSIVVVPPASSPLPELETAAALDLRAAPDGSTLGEVDVRWEELATTTLRLAVRMSDGSVPAKQVAVRIDSLDPCGSNATPLCSSGAAAVGEDTQQARGSIRREGVTDATGTITLADLPRAEYQLTLLPPTDLADSATTTVERLILTSAGNQTNYAVQLSRKVKLSGRLTPLASAVDARVVATDTAGDVLLAVLSAKVDGQGRYEMLADPGRTYRILVEPAAGKNLPQRIPLYGIKTQTDMVLKDWVLPSGLRVSGTVTFAGTPLPGAVVQAFCWQGARAECVDPDHVTSDLPRPIAETASLADGSYTFYLPDPATGS